MEYKRNVKIILLNNEFYNKKGEKVILDTSFRIMGKKYHFECQSSKDSSMVFRMFEYDFQIGASEVKEEKYLKFTFPKSCVVYVSQNRNYPKRLQMKINFPDGGYHTYEVPTIRIQDYTLEDIEEKELELFIPFLIAGYRTKFQRKKKPTTEEITALVQEMIEVLNHLYYSNKITNKEFSVITDSMKQTINYELFQHKEIVKEVNAMMTELLELPTLRFVEERERETAIKVERKTAVNLLKEGVDLTIIARATKLSIEEVIALKESIDKKE